MNRLPSRLVQFTEFKLEQECRLRALFRVKLKTKSQFQLSRDSCFDHFLDALNLGLAESALLQFFYVNGGGATDGFVQFFDLVGLVYAHWEPPGGRYLQAEFGVPFLVITKP